MALDHSTLREPAATIRSVTGATIADYAVQVTPPAWAGSVDIYSTGTVLFSYEAATTTFPAGQPNTIPPDRGRNIPLQTREQTNAAVPYWIAAATAAVVEFHYIPRGF